MRILLTQAATVKHPETERDHHMMLLSGVVAGLSLPYNVCAQGRSFIWLISLSIALECSRIRS